MKPTVSRALDWGGRFFRTDLRYAVSGGFFLGLTQISSAIIGFALTVAFANLLPIDTYGTYRYILAAYALLSLAALPGIDTALLRSVSTGKDGSFTDGLRIKLKWSLIGTLGALLYAGYLYSQGSLILAGLFVVVAFSLPAMESFALFSSVFNGKREFKTWAFFDVLTQVISGVCLVATMLLTKNIIVLMIAYFAPYIFVRFIGTVYTRRRYISNDAHDAEMYSYGMSVTMFQVINRLTNSIDQIVLYHLLGPAQVAIYSLAMAIPNRAQSLFKISGTLAFPKFAAREASEVAASLPRKMFIFLSLILLSCVAYVVAAPYLFQYLFPQYMASLPYSQLVIFFTLSAVSYPFSALLFAHRRIAENYIVALLGFATKIVSLALFVPVYGIWGAIAGVLAASFVMTLAAFVLIWKEASRPSAVK